MDFSSLLNGGLSPSSQYSLSSTNYNSITSGGLNLVGNGVVPTGVSTPATAVASSQILIPSTVQSQINGLISVSDPYGHTIVPTAGGYVDLGVNGTGNIIGSNQVAASLGNNSMLSSSFGNLGLQSFTGVDLKLLLEVPSNTGTNQGSTYKQLIECHTISVSSYRMKNPVRSLGYTNPKGFSRGLRTIAGTMVITEMSVDVLLTFLQAVVIKDKTKDSNITKSDQLPPINITMVFANEEGAASYRTLLGVEFLNDGVVYSVQDMLVERTISWMAADFTPLLPLDVSSLFKATVNNATTLPSEATPSTIMNSTTTGSALTYV